LNRRDVARHVDAWACGCWPCMHRSCMRPIDGHPTVHVAFFGVNQRTAARPWSLDGGGKEAHREDPGDGGDAEEAAASLAVLLYRGIRACRDIAAYGESHVDPPRRFLVTVSNAGSTDHSGMAEQTQGRGGAAPAVSDARASGRWRGSGCRRRRPACSGWSSVDGGLPA
jgi:hypothetical protein